MELVKRGSRGRITLGEKILTSEYYEVEMAEDGTVILHPVNVTRANAQVFEESSGSMTTSVTREDVTDAISEIREGR
ncbi:hypothetical protein [Nocardiopsis alba]|uniref:Uncharacterized protein n=2 Tax=Nocardiopsis alba TaxID=53437 RepID=A0ABV5DWE0_9ACTN|nr:hypothetical protein [Nocardiopsis alba]AFR09491.1 hypothetical protein B005_2075 [Nocardiopsis alba ATCC BAA-2165]